MKTRMRTRVLALILAFTAAVAYAENRESPIRPGELVFIDVYRHGDLSTTVQVQPDGNVVLPHDIGSVQVAGLTEDEASAVVSKAYLRILKNPRVQVSRSGTSHSGYGYRTENMQTEIIPLNNADAESLSESLQGVTSEGGAVSFDPDTNSLIVTDTPSAVQNVISVVNRLDEMRNQLTQVRIEAKLAEVQVGAMKELGVRWFTQGDRAGGGYYPMPNDTTALNAAKGQSADPSSNESVGGRTSSNTLSSGSGRRYINEEDFDRRVQIPVQIAKVGQMFFGYNNSGIDLGVMLDALVADDRAEMLANPYTIAVNHKTAEIEMVEEFPYTEYGTEGLRTTYSTRFLDLGIKLEVTPHVLKDEGGDYVKLELYPEVSYAVGTNDGVPIRAVRSTNGEANVRDNQTLVIGGIYRNEAQNVNQGVPGLRKVPLLGKLFKRTEKVQSKTELMIFVTPTIYESPENVTWDKMIDLTSLELEEPPGPAAAAEQEAPRE